MKKRLIVLAALFAIGGAVAATAPGNTAVAVHRSVALGVNAGSHHSGHF